MLGGEGGGEGNPAMDQGPIQGAVEILLIASCYSYRNRDKLYLPTRDHVEFLLLKMVNDIN